MAMSDDHREFYRLSHQINMKLMRDMAQQQERPLRYVILQAILMAVICILIGMGMGVGLMLLERSL